MKTPRRFLFLLFLAPLNALAPSRAAQPPAPSTLNLQLVYVNEGTEMRYVFVIGQSGFTSVESLKAYLGTLPKGTEVRWAPGCERLGREPLLSSERDMKDFEAFLKRKGIKFTLVPAG